MLMTLKGTYGRVLKGGIPDKVAAARQVLKDWNSGRIPYYTVPPRDSAPEKSNDAVVFSSFSKEFDLSHFDHAVMSSLKDKDEMDFVQLDRTNADDTAESEKWSEAADLMMRDESDDSEGNEDVEDMNE